MEQLPAAQLYFPSLGLSAASRERLFSLLTQSFTSTPPGRPLCLHAILSSLPALVNLGLAIPHPVFGTRLVQDYPDFVEALTSFVLARPKREQVEELAEIFFRPGACACNLTDPLVKQLHGKLVGLVDGLPPPFFAMRGLADGLFSVLLRVLSSLDEQKLDRIFERKNPRPKDRGFRTLVAQIRDHPHRLLEVSSHWFLATKALQCAVATTSFKEVHPVRFVGTFAAIHPHFPFELLLCIHKQLEDAQEMQMVVPNILNTCVEYSNVLTRLTNGLDISFPEQVVLFLHDHRRVYLEICNLFRNFLRDPVIAASEDMTFGLFPSLALAAKRIYNHFMPSGSTVGAFDPRISRWASSGVCSPDATLLYCDVHSVMTKLQNNNVCANITCRAAPKSSLKRFDRCGRCKIVSYCSQKCQRAAWDSPLLPHKSFCRTWAKLTEIWPPFVEESTLMNLQGVAEEVRKTAAVSHGFSEEKMRKFLRKSEVFEVAMWRYWA